MTGDKAVQRGPSVGRRMAISHTIVALVAALVVAILAGGLILRAYSDLAREQANVAERTTALLLGQLFERNGNWVRAEAGLARIIADRPEALGRRMLVADERGRIIYDSADQLEGEALPQAARRTALPIVARGREVGYVAVLVGGENLTLAERGFVRQIVGIVLGGAIVGVAASVVVGGLMARRITRPLRHLTTAVNRLADGGHHEPVAQPSERELAELAEAFNTMAQQLDRQEQLRRNMVADIAHELRTPLSVLRLKVESLEDGLATADPQTFATLGREIDLLARLVDDLRLLSLADAGRLSLNYAPLDPAEALTRAAAAAAERARARQIELKLAIAPQLPLIRADPQRVTQIFGNLIENALRYTPEHGRVTLEATHDQQRNLVLFAITDTGPGIAPADVARIFDRFYRGDRARTRETGGSGLGLAIVQQLVEAHSGMIEVESMVGMGSRFRVGLPVHEGGTR